MENKYWKFNGRYGDDFFEIEIIKEPKDISEDLQKKLCSLYESRKPDYTSDYYVLKELGLLQEVGNAWNTILVFAPIVDEWMIEKNKNITK